MGENMITAYEKYYPEENIEVGDLVCLVPNTNAVKLAFNGFKDKSSKVIGICTKIENNLIYVTNTGIVDVNIQGLTCIGDNITSSNIPGKAQCIRYEQDKSIFNIRSIGKIIQLYNNYNKVKVILNIK